MSAWGWAVERTRRHRRDRSSSPSALPRRSLNAAGRLAVRAIAAALAGWALGGCSLSFPVEGVGVDAAATGSVDRTAALLAASLDGEDLRRAKAAMAVALDPQGNGARVGWQNPQTGAVGAFAAVRAPYPDHDRVCRAFVGEVATARGAERKLRGSACRDGDGTWVVQAGA